MPVGPRNDGEVGPNVASGQKYLDQAYPRDGVSNPGWSTRYSSGGNGVGAIPGMSFKALP